jgi:hypothetical protein
MIELQIVNTTAIPSIIIDKGSDIVVGVIVALIVGIGGYVLGTHNEKRSSYFKVK